MALVFDKNGGVAMATNGSQKYSVWAAKYLPIVGVVLLSAFWKSVMCELKEITPWASISNKWNSASQSVFLDYITGKDITSVLQAARFRHFALLLSLLAGFLCGAASPLANSLTYVNPHAVHEESAAFLLNTTFNYNGTLMKPDGSMFGVDHISSLPYAGVASSRLAGGRYPNWTKDSFAFESFAEGSPAAAGEGRAVAEVQAFSSHFDCHALNYSVVSEDFFHRFSASPINGSGLNCSKPILQNFTFGIESNVDDDTSPKVADHLTRAWLNLSSCSPSGSDYVTASIAFLDHLGGVAIDGNLSYLPYRTTAITGVIYSIDFYQQNAEITVNRSTGEVIDYNVPTPTEEDQIDPGLSMAALWLYLNNLQELYTTGGVSTSNVWSSASYTSSFSQMDAFFGMLSGGDYKHLERYLDNGTSLRTDIGRLSEAILAQVVSIRARKDAVKPVTGKVKTQGPRLLVHSQILVALQVILLLIGLVTLLISTLLRPKSDFSEDPGQLAAGAVLLAHPTGRLENICAHGAAASPKDSHKSLDYSDWKLNSTPDGMLELQCRTSGINTTDAKDLAGKPLRDEGWRPLPLHLVFKSVSSCALLSLIVTLAILLSISRTNEGLAHEGEFTQIAFHFVSTTIIAVLGYVCSGIDAAVQQVSLYEGLWSKHRKRMQLVDHVSQSKINQFQIRRHHELSQIASKTAVLLFPILKIIAAGLYGVHSSEVVDQSSFSVDASLTTHAIPAFLDLESQDNYRFISDQAFQYTQWTQGQAFDIVAKSGNVGHLVLSDLSDVGSSGAPRNKTGSTVTIRVPAISIDVAYKKLDEPLLFVVSWSPSDPCWLLTNETFCDISIQTGLFANCSKNQAKYAGNFMPDNDTFNFCLADISNFVGPVSNATPIMYNEPIKPEVFNISYPQFFLFSGSVKVTRVHVDTVYAYNKDHSWTPIGYNTSTIETDGQSVSIREYTNGLWSDYLYSNNLWPNASNPFQALKVGRDPGVFRLMSIYAEYQLHNLSALMDQEKLGEVLKTALVAYYTELLAEYRPFALRNATAEGINPQIVGGILRYYQTRIIQDKSTTIILEALLATIFCCYLWVFLRFPNHSILPESPGSIAARLSLLAHSNLVQQIREKKITRITDQEIWDKASLGWWKRAEETDQEIVADGADNFHEQPLPRYRWGIDIGEPVSRRGWNEDISSLEEDFGHGAAQDGGGGASLAAAAGVSSAVDAQPDAIELQNLRNRRDEAHGEQSSLHQENAQDSSGREASAFGLNLGSGAQVKLDDSLNTQTPDSEILEPGFAISRSEDPADDGASQPLLRPESR
ncbi:hypothetical protein IWZ00DRAFT_533210 [Phyllosticta capitalensis]